MYCESCLSLKTFFGNLLIPFNYFSLAWFRGGNFKLVTTIHIQPNSSSLPNIQILNSSSLSAIGFWHEYMERKLSVLPAARYVYKTITKDFIILFNSVNKQCVKSVVAIILNGYRQLRSVDIMR